MGTIRVPAPTIKLPVSGSRRRPSPRLRLRNVGLADGSTAETCNGWSRQVSRDQLRRLANDPDHAADLACAWCFRAFIPIGTADPTGQLSDGSRICERCVKGLAGGE